MRLCFRILPAPELLTLGIVAATLVGIIRLELREGAPNEALVPTQSLRQQSPSSPAPASRDRSKNQNGQHVATILARPLFSLTRRPPAPASAYKQAAPGLARLSGVIVSQAGKIAIFAGPPNGKSIVAGEGAHVGEYFVRSITANAVTVNGPSGEFVLHPAFDPNPPQKIASTQPVSSPTPSATPEVPPVLVAQFQRALRDWQQHRDQSSRQ